MNKATRKRVLSDFHEELVGWQPDPKWEFLYRRQGPIEQRVGPVGMRGTSYRLVAGLLVLCTPLKGHALALGAPLNIYRGGDVLSMSLHDDPARMAALRRAAANALVPSPLEPLTTSATRAALESSLPRASFALAYLSAWDGDPATARQHAESFMEHYGPFRDAWAWVEPEARALEDLLDHLSIGDAQAWVRSQAT